MGPTISREELAERIAELRPPDRRTVLVAIDGWGGSGKTSLAEWLADRLGGTRVCSDDFARPGVLGWEWRRFDEQVLSPLRADERVRYQRYDWDDDQLAEWHEIEPGGFLIAEGVSISRKELGDPWDLKVWVECPYELRLARGVKRDGEAMRDTWVNLWLPEEVRYVEEQRPHERADYIVLGYKENGMDEANPDLDERIRLHYEEEQREEERLSRRAGRLEFVRTMEILERFLPQPPARIVDVGAGTGVYAVPLAERGYAVHLVEPIERHLELAKAAANERGIAFLA
ncbi:MAG: hypothetical protein ACRDI3_04535, partial [Actinomycetota bacterium]